MTGQDSVGETDDMVDESISRGRVREQMFTLPTANAWGSNEDEATIECPARTISRIRSSTLHLAKPSSYRALNQALPKQSQYPNFSASRYGFARDRNVSSTRDRGPSQACAHLEYHALDFRTFHRQTGGIWDVARRQKAAYRRENVHMCKE